MEKQNPETIVPVAREKKLLLHYEYLEAAARFLGTIVFAGASIIANFTETDVWEKLYAKELNIGIGGDRTQHVLWRLQKMKLPSTVKYAVLHCGTNNIGKNTPQEIAMGIKTCGLQLLKMVPDLKLIIAGILPMDLIPSQNRVDIRETNTILEELCKSMANTTYLTPNGWINEYGVLERKLYRKDNLHLSFTGYAKFADEITKMMDSIISDTASPKSSRRSKLPPRLCGTGHRYRHRCPHRYPQSSSPSPSPPPTVHRPLRRRPRRHRPTQSRIPGPQRYHYPLSSSPSSSSPLSSSPLSSSPSP